MRFELLCTLGPASLNERVLPRLDELGVDLFRINLSHTEIDDLSEIVHFIRQHSTVSICLDTEGAQIRTGRLSNGQVLLRENEIIRVPRRKIIGDETTFNFYPHDIISKLEIGDLVSIDFNSVLVQVIEKNDAEVKARVFVGGLVGQNKAVTVDRDIYLPVLTEKDRKALAMGAELGIKHVALSFANRAEDVDDIRAVAGADAIVISKIECINGIIHFDDIAAASDVLLLDRSDLSRQIPIEVIPQLQKDFIQRARQQGVKIYVATNLLESMITSPVPTRAEVNDIYNTLADGASGLVLAAETAIGFYPVRCVVMVSKIIKQFSKPLDISSSKNVREQTSLLLVEPHGGKLVIRSRFEVDPHSFISKTVQVSRTVLSSAEQIALGTFSPLCGFMHKNELDAVLNEYCLPNGTVWPLPIVLQIDEDMARGLSVGTVVGMVLGGTNEIYAGLHLEDIYKYDLDEMALKTFGTNDDNHPGVQLLKQGGELFLAGEIELYRRLPSKYKLYEITPRQARTIFEGKGWSKVVGFHTRNVIHRVHEYIQMNALEKYHCDGILIHPVTGRKKLGDYTADIILKSYELMVDRFYPKGKVLLAAFQNYSRYSGPREAVFTALCRKNFGCSHFVVGRDHTGVGNYYKNGDARILFEQLGDIGITPIFFDEVYYCAQCGQYVEGCKHGDQTKFSISGTDGREIIQSGEIPPDWFMRQDISKLILNELSGGNEVFIH